MQTDQVAPFSRPMSGITLERSILPDIEKHPNPQKKEKPVSRNVLQTKGHTAVVDYDAKHSAHKPSGSMKSRNQSALDVQTTQNTDYVTSSRVLGRNGSDQSLLTIGIADLKNNAPMKRNGSLGNNGLLKDHSNLLLNINLRNRPQANSQHNGSLKESAQSSSIVHRVGDATFKKVGSQ